MTSSITIKSANSDYSLTFSSIEGDYFTVEVNGVDRSGKIRVWGYSDCQFLANLFESIAKDWKGWEGERDWSSIEGEFELFATADKSGHITLRTCLTNATSGPSELWKLEASIVVEAGQLDKISREVGSFFSAAGV